MPPITDYSYGATPSTIAPREYKMLDAELALRDYADAAETTDAAETAVDFRAEQVKDFKIVINSAAIGGTVDSSNYWNVIVEADNESGFTSPVVLANVQLTAAAAENSIPMSGERVRQLRLAASMTTEITLVRVRADETGSTAGNLSYGCYISPI